MHRFCIAVLFIVERKDGSKLTFPTEIDADNELTEPLVSSPWLLVMYILLRSIQFELLSDSCSFKIWGARMDQNSRSLLKLMLIMS